MRSAQPRPYFTVGVKHAMSLEIDHDPDVRDPGSFSMRGHSVGGYGSVTTNKIIATIGPASAVALSSPVRLRSQNSPIGVHRRSVFG